jgi:phosphohistidine phosphatase
MRIFLIQHGDAIPETEDQSRPLSEKGIAQIKKTAGFLKQLHHRPDIIWHSDKKRSRDSAEIISEALGHVPMEFRVSMNPNDSIDDIKRDLINSEKSIMIVGHMPFIGKLISHLLFLNDERAYIDITNASPVIIERTGKGYILTVFLKNEYIK